MGLTLQLSKLASRAARTSISGKEGGVRRIAVSALTKIKDVNEEPTSFWDGLGRFVGGIISGIKWGLGWLKIGIGSLIRGAIQAVQFVLNFNINATDQQLDEEIKQMDIAIAGARGAARGAFVGYLVCGIAPTAVLAVFNEPLALYTLMEVGEEAAEEIAANISTLIQLQNRKMLRSAFNTVFKNYRNILRPAAIGFARILQFAGFLDKESVDKANAQRDKPWSIHSALEDTIERIQDPAEQAEAEEFWEEFGEACVEAGYIVAGAIDSWFIQQKLNEKAAQQQQQNVVIMSPSGAIDLTPDTP